MKKALSLFLAILIIALSVPFALAANYNGFVYEYNDNGTYSITGYTDFYTNSVVIPSSISGIPVTSVEQGAFQLKSNITSVSIPDSIEYIGALAFYNCTNLTSVTIGNNVGSIGAKAFNSCSSLTSVNLNNTEVVGEYAFYGCGNLTTLYCGSALKVIGKNAFTDCTSLNYIIWSDALIYIDAYAFSGCTAIASLSLPDSLAYIGNSSFKGCTSLADVRFGAGELQIEAYAFENCTSLTAVTVPDNVTAVGRLAFGLREDNSNEFTHTVTITCNSYSAAASYVKLYNVPVYFEDIGSSIELFGDVVSDGIIDTNDAVAALRVAAGLEETLTDLFLIDLNSNGTVDTGDVQLILRKATGQL